MEEGFCYLTVCSSVGGTFLSSFSKNSIYPRFFPFLFKGREEALVLSHIYERSF